MKKKFTIAIIALGLSIGLSFPQEVKAADAAHYELKGWTAGVLGDSAGVTFGYIGSDGVPLTVGLPMGKDLFQGHENDPSWTKYDSAAPILAYINKYGIDNNIRETMNPSYFDPTILKALQGQGVTIQQLGGPANPQVGKANYPDTINKVLVGVGIPAPSLPTKSNSITPASPTSSSQTVSSSPTPPAPVPPPKNTQTTEAKVGTNLNPVPDAKETPNQSQAIQERLNPPAKAIDDTTPTQIKESENTTPKKKTSWVWYGSLTGTAVLALGILTYFYIKKKKISAQ